MDERASDEGDISTVEMYRPDGGAHEMSMDNAQIPATTTVKLPASLTTLRTDRKSEP